MTVCDQGTTLAQTVGDAARTATPLRICGGNSKTFYGRAPHGTVLDVGAHRGVINYEPTELVLTARAGTPLARIEALLASEQQMLGFEPPAYGTTATLGGTIAGNFSGPRRAYAGAARDFVLGMRIVNGKGEILRFGGEVMKNVAGYDVSRLMTGALGTLGVILDVSLKVLPRPETERTIRLECNARVAIERLQALAQQPWPISASCHVDGQLYIRLSGTAGAVHAACLALGGDTLDAADVFWQQVREHQHAFFADTSPLWRLSIDAAAPPLVLDGAWLMEWGGALRWLKTDRDAVAVRAAAEQAGGHAILFRDGTHRDAVFHPLAPGLLGLHRQLKQAFDPAGILNPGRLYAEL